MPMPPRVSEFLAGRRLAVTGVSRDRRHFANLIYRKLQTAGHDVVPVNPRTSEVEGVRCYPDVAAIDGPIDGVMIASPPAASLAPVGQCADRGVRQVWLHRSFGAGSVSADAVRECDARGLSCIVGGCPMMYVAPVDPAHRCMRWLLRWRGRVPG